jgi:hypothetical protein
VELDRALAEIDEIADILKLRYARSTFGWAISYLVYGMKRNGKKSKKLHMQTVNVKERKAGQRKNHHTKLEMQDFSFT